jgi:hypothetical protein
MGKQHGMAALGRAVDRLGDQSWDRTAIMASDADAELERVFGKLRTPQLRELSDYWLARRGDRAMPRLADIDPVHLPRHLPNLILAEVLQDPLRFRFRVVGTALERQLGRSYTGQTIGAEARGFYKAYARCVEKSQPTREYMRYDFGEGQTPGEFERLLLPLSNNDTDVHMILGEVVYKNLHTRQDL